MNFEAIQKLIADEKDGVTYNDFCKRLNSYPIHRDSLGEEVIGIIERVEDGSYTVEDYETYLTFDLTQCDRLCVNSNDEVQVLAYEELHDSYYQVRLNQSMEELSREFEAWKFKLVAECDEESFDKIISTTQRKLRYYEEELLGTKSFASYLPIIQSNFLKIEDSLLELKRRLWPKNEVIAQKEPESVANSKNENKFNSMELDLVKKHFWQLTQKISKAGGKPHLSEKQFEQFITNAFSGHDDSPKEKIKMNIAHGEFGTIRFLFYKFYDLCKIDYESTNQNKDKYVRLLTDNFEGFDYKKTADNFNK
ncbi:hypothetical protein [Runella aurantiaca]|uniref:Uncharacterized protein n=1 Tax=Runella aurantiaca TaxID=2282308 RepID=A0A369II24_9BACT|nr:hypothetical protein [Runella aurantiaca]RDB06914.1 hypothetical protein DVG78_06450 [Runella aurantiaca]